MRILVFGFIFICAVIVSYFMFLNNNKPKALKIYNPIDINPEMVDSLMQRKGYGHKIGSFSFLNQNNKTITLNNVKGKVFVVEYFFTTCSTICPIMNTQMQRVQNAFRSENKFSILSFTVDPETDTLEQMKKNSS